METLQKQSLPYTRSDEHDPAISDDDALATPFGQSCGVTCSDDDSAARDFLEASFCDKIKNSASPNLARFVAPLVCWWTFALI